MSRSTTPSKTKETKEVKQKYSFPTSSKDEESKFPALVNCLKAMNIGFTLEDCKAPTSARVSALMADFVTFFKGVSKSELSQAPFDMLNKLGEHPEIHADSMADNAMLKMGLDLLLSVGMHDASLRDILAPTPQRLRIMLCGLINYARFREPMLLRYEKTAQEIDTLGDEKAKVAAENESLDAEAKKLKQETEVLQQTRAALKAEVEARQMEIEQATKLLVRQKDESDQAKSTIAKLKDELATLEFNTLTEKQACDTLRSQIVRSPERVQRSLRDAESKINIKRQEVAAAQQTRAVHRDKYNALHKLTAAINERRGQVADVVALQEACKSAAASAKRHDEEREEMEGQIRTLVKQEQTLRGDIDKGEKQLYELQKSHGAKRQQASAALDAVQKQKVAIQKSIATAKATNTHIEAQIAAKRREIEILVANNKEEMDLGRNKFHEAVGSLKAYHESVMKAMAAASAPTLASH